MPYSIKMSLQNEEQQIPDAIDQTKEIARKRIISDIEGMGDFNNKKMLASPGELIAKQSEKESLSKGGLNQAAGLTRRDIESIDISVKKQTERVSKYLSRSSVCSRRQAEKLIEQGMVRVNGKKILSNVEIDPLKDEVSLFTRRGEYFPMKENSRIWLMYKPMGLICTHRDPHKRPTIFDFIKQSGAIKEDFVISVGRLDFNSEGLILLTNDGELARCLEHPQNKLERTYRVRVYGRFSEEKLAKIREGCVINGMRYGPFYCNVDSYQTRNTWLIVKMHQGKNREIRRVMQKNDLRVNRLKRLSYGPYSLGNMAAGEIREDIVRDEVKRLMYLNRRAALKNIEEAKDDAVAIKEKVAEKLEGRLLDPVPMILKAKSRLESQVASAALEGSSSTRPSASEPEASKHRRRIA